MSYESPKVNKLNKFFCSECDQLLNKGAYSKYNCSKKLFCKDCASLLSSEEIKQIEQKESYQEVGECLKLIEKTIRTTRNPQPQDQEEKDCEICKGSNSLEINRALFYCLNDEMMFCYECFEQNHSSIVSQKHKKVSVSEWMTKYVDQSMDENVDGKKTYHCFKHKFCQPVFCIEDQTMFCPSCYIDNHSRHRIIGIKERAKEEKQRINLESNMKSFKERMNEFSKIEIELTKLKNIFEEQTNEIKKMINESKKSLSTLKETTENWDQMEIELDDKEWCKSNFVDKLKDQVEIVDQKWKEREMQLKNKTKDIVKKIDDELIEFYYNLLSEIERDEIKRNRELREKERNEMIEKERFEEMKEKDLEKTPLKKNEKKEMIKRIDQNLIDNTKILAKLEKQVKELERERIQNEQWKGSSLIKKAIDIEFLNDCLKECGFRAPIIKTKLFQASRHSFLSSRFHNLCDNQGKTIVVVECTSGRIFGGFSNVDWNSSGKISDNEGKSFLFNLDQMKKFYLIEKKCSIQGLPQYGPIFGCVGLLISNECHLNQKSFWGSKGYSFDFVGMKKFKVKEYEVWRVE